MLVCSVQIITRLDGQSKFQMLTLFSGRHISAPQRAPTWRFHTGLCKFLRNISTNICSLGKRTDLNLGDASSLFVSYKITISWLYPLNSFRFIFFIAWQRKRSLDPQLIQLIHKEPSYPFRIWIKDCPFRSRFCFLRDKIYCYREFFTVNVKMPKI